MSFASLLAGQLRGGTAFLAGTPAEAAFLFGSPLPELPPGEADAAGAERIAVETNPRLREAFARWLGAIERVIAGGAHGVAGSPAEEAEREYHDLLAADCRAVIAADRRQGLHNLFWLAHARELAEVVDRHCSGPGRPPGLRYRVHPVVAGLLNRARESVRRGLTRPQLALHDFRSGGGADGTLVRAIVEDQLPLTEPDVRAFDPLRVLGPDNPRFRIGGPAFLEITRILRERLARGLAGGETGLKRAVREAFPAAVPEPAGDPRRLDRVVFSEPVRGHLLGDLEGTGTELARSKVLRAERAHGTGWSDLLEAYADLTRCLRRAEAIAALGRSLDLAARSVDDAQTRERFLEGRSYRFSGRGRVHSGLRAATILFADIRGFTRASEGHVSEGDLVRELYEIFDPAALVVRRFGGVVDKYLGDGFMATFAAGIRAGEETLAAVRCAVAIQHVLGRLRAQGRTAFTMGISLHAGRVAVARFLRDGREVDTTLVGKAVNVAGRLSASFGEGEGEGDAAGAGAPAAPAASRRVGEVALDGSGGLVNRGIAVSGALLDLVRKLVPLEPFREGAVEGLRWYDRDLALWLYFGYVGEAHFKGLDASVPVWSLVAAPPGEP